MLNFPKKIVRHADNRKRPMYDNQVKKKKKQPIKIDSGLT